MSRLEPDGPPADEARVDPEPRPRMSTVPCTCGAQHIADHRPTCPWGDPWAPDPRGTP